MSHIGQRLLVVGGNGFIGSAVCKAALARGMEVTSISSSGKPYVTPKGHSPKWISNVTWLSADALTPSTYEHLLPRTTAVVHTLGTILEDTRYKVALKSGGTRGLLESVLGSVTGGRFGGGNPLERNETLRKGSYETLNRDAALRVCETFISTEPDPSLDLATARPFIYLSAEDMTRPIIPTRYISTKRDAERKIESMLAGRPNYRGVYIRPSLVYHPHLRPFTTPIATILDISSTLHRKAPSSLPTPASIFRSMEAAISSSSSSSQDSIQSSFFASIANSLTIPPIHVDHVAQAICLAIQNENVRGAVGVKEMRELIGWADMSSDTK